ncbi:cellulase family glycosylhydrolase [Ruminiclostridium herbifermentans]|uniref:Cellulase family glycosylhydrolase n=1 Tax=Ruminiclostridium herbifermentans TaxID=2488810 RepID=A0A4U7JJ76_9FIRM|nr:cellulase family glycosylhydrolase [Ruminiclostridium herbifermentans]QNU68504.1 cellulase family glycosylhydrolase [Ruminiclostridium herbifermentans]
MSKEKRILVNQENEIPFHNGMDFCVGTGRMFLALHKEYYEQLKMVQEAIGFKYIRGHGLFFSDMSIVHTYKDELGRDAVEYNFTYLDRVIDSYLSLGIRPFLELTFMPEHMASSGETTTFEWKANITPPKNHKEWTDMVQATLRHLLEHYGREEVLKWPIEVWNEPNQEDFWKDADMQSYFKLYEHTALAIKEVDPDFIVGGPAISGQLDEIWMRAFLEFVRDKKLPLDFVSRHNYIPHPPDKVGRYSYVKLCDIDFWLEPLDKTKAIIESFPEFKGIDIHITEYSTSYLPNCTIHDTNLNAAYIAAVLSRLGDKHVSYSYWTFSDVFEEKGVPFTPFHGGFGMVANNCIPKPTFWTFAFYKKLQGKCVHRSEEAIIMQLPNENYRGVLWNIDFKYNGEIMELLLQLPVKYNEYCLITKTVDEECCNPLKLWHDMGEPANLSAEQTAILKEHAVPLIKSESIVPVNSITEIKVTLNPNAVIYFELNRVERKTDRGYSYERTLKGEL